VDALCALLQDSNVLVQRSTLDLLLHVFPIHCCHLTQLDTVTVLTAAIGVVLRRDMSLNRRLYAWLVGTDANGVPITAIAGGVSPPGSLDRQDSEPTMDYFNKHSETFLVLAVKRSLNASNGVDESRKSSTSSVKLRPFKILMSLLDKPEIGSAILEDIFLDVLRCIYRECVTVSGSGADQRAKVGPDGKNDDSITEVVKTANLLLGSLEPSFIWQFIAESLDLACARQPAASDCISRKANGSPTLDQHWTDTSLMPTSDCISLLELCTIVDFMLDKLSVVGVFITSQLDCKGMALGSSLGGLGLGGLWGLVTFGCQLFTASWLAGLVHLNFRLPESILLLSMKNLGLNFHLENVGTKLKFCAPISSSLKICSCLL